MILAIDIGNTNIVVGCVDEKKTYFIERLSTDRSKTDLEYAIMIKNVLDIYRISPEQLEGGIVSSVVPQITMVAKMAAEKIVKKEILVVGAGIKTGLNILIDNPAQLGSDLVADAVAGINEYPVPLIIFDMGTATTVSAVDRNKNYLGGMILPGIRTSLDAGNRSGTAQKTDRKEYHRLHEKRRHLWKCRLCGRGDRADERGAGRGCHGGGHRRSREMHYSLLQGEDHSG